MKKINTLYPIFLKTEQLEILIVGGGLVALEKLKFLLKSSPKSKITIVAPLIQKDIYLLQKKGYNINFIHSLYNKIFLKKKNFVIATTKDPNINLQVYNDCKNQTILVNVADHPHVCDFYMGGIVTKGNLKIAISTNGKSPTMAKRFREILEETIPDEIDNLLVKINDYRKTLKENFNKKLEILDKLTS